MTRASIPAVHNRAWSGDELYTIIVGVIHSNLHCALICLHVQSLNHLATPAQSGGAVFTKNSLRFSQRPAAPA